MRKLSFNPNAWMGFKVVLVFLLFAGLNFGTHPEGEFYKKEVALENAIAGSGGPKCKTGPRCPSGTYRYCDTGGTGDSCVCYNCN